MPSWWPQHQLLKHNQPLIPLSTVQRPTIAYRNKTIPSQLCEKGKYNRVTIPTKRRNTAQATRQLRVVLGPSMAKTTQQQPKNREYQQPKLQMSDGNNPQSQNKGEAKLLAWTGKTQQSPNIHESTAHSSSTQR